MKPTRARADRRRSGLVGIFAAMLLPLVLSGCPLSDDYFIAPSAGGAGTTSGGASGSGTSGISPGAGGSGVMGGSSGTENGTGGSGLAGGSAVGGAAAGMPAAAGGGAGGSTGNVGGSGDTGSGADAGEGGADSPACTPEPELCDGVSTDCDDESGEEAVCPRSCSARQFDGHVYVLCMFADEAEWQPYSAATDRCSGLGAELALDIDFELSWLESSEENAFLKEWIATTAPVAGMVWIGANDLDDEGRWVWGRGDDARRFFDSANDGGGQAYQDRFHDFGEGRPNSANETDEDCGAFDSEVDWHWNDLKCSTWRLGYVCEQIQ